MRIKVILPVPVRSGGNAGPIVDLICARRSVALPSTELEFVAPSSGLGSFSGLADRFISAMTLWPAAAVAAEQGFDAVVVDCTCDQLVDMCGHLEVPLVSSLQASLHAASLIAERYAVITPNKGQVPVYRHLVSRYGFDRNVVSVREAYSSSGASDSEQEFSALREASEQAIGKSGAELIILGCTAFTHDEQLAQVLGVPVVAPGSVAIKTAEMLVALGQGSAEGSSILPQTRQWPLMGQEFDLVTVNEDGEIVTVRQQPCGHGGTISQPKGDGHAR